MNGLDDHLRRILLSLSILLAVILLGVLGSMKLMDLNLVQALYVTIVTMTTTGFGDFVPTNDLGRIFVVFLLLGGVGAVAFASTSMVHLVVEGQLQNFLGRRSMQKDIEKLNRHIIVCGAGRVGENVINRLLAEKRQFVAIEQDEEICRRLRKRGVLIICDNATKDEVLFQAGIERASGLISALSGDTDNVYVTLTAKSINPNIRVVSRVERLESESKLLRAGADRVISPAVLGGQRMASAMLKPASVEFVETVLHRTNLEIVLEELEVSPNSPLVDKAISSSLIRSASGITIVGIVRGSEFILNPGGKEILRANDVLIVLGKREQLPHFETLVAPLDFSVASP
ncbi:MAG: potassium channel protein [Syntrophomonadaceae bacterium]|nr:potassium channel protein [Syntrophomonadaceae bacterium]